MSVLAKFKEYKGTQIKPTYQKGTEKQKEDTKKDYEPKIAKVEKQEFKPFTPALPFVPTVPTQQRLSFNQPKLIESDLPKTTKVTAPITGSTFGLDNVKTYQAPIGQSKKELDIKDKAEKKEAKETADTLQKELTEKYGFKVKRANSPIEYANILLKVPSNQKEQFKKDYDQYILASERSDPFRAGAEAGFNILPTNLEKTQGKEVVEEAKGFGAGRFVGGAGQQAAFASVLNSPIEGLVGKVLPKATPLVTETIKDVVIGTGTQLAEMPFDKPTAGQFVGNAALDVALNVLFGAVGNGLSKVDLFNLRSAKPKSVVTDVARELGVSEAEADKVLDNAIDNYLNKIRTAQPTVEPRMVGVMQSKIKPTIKDFDEKFEFNKDSIESATTGKPIVFEGMRFGKPKTTEKTGDYYGISTGYISRYGKERELNLGNIITKRVELDNPLVITDLNGGKYDVAYKIALDLPKTDSQISTKLLNKLEENLKANFSDQKLETELDELIKQGGERLGYDGIVIKRKTYGNQDNSSEIIEFGNKYPTLAKDFAKEAPKQVKPRIEPTLKPVAEDIGAVPQSARLDITPTLKPKQVAEPIDTLSKVMTEMPTKAKPKLGENLERIYQETVSKNAPFEAIARKTDTDILRAYSSNLNRTTGTIDHNIAKYQSDMEGNQVGDSIQGIFKEVDETTKPQFFDYVLNKHNVERYGQGKPVFGDTVTSDVSLAKASQYEADYPQFVEQQKKVTTYFNNLMNEWAVKSGLVSEDTAKMLKEMYPNYVPTYRATEIEKAMGSGDGNFVSQVLKKAKGSEKDILPLDQQMAILTDRTIRNARKNEVMTMLDDVYQANPEIASKYIYDVKKVGEKSKVDDLLDVGKELEKPVVKEGDKYKVTYYRNGEPYQMTINKTLYESLATVEKDALDKGLDVIKKYATNPFKSLITQKNPIFFVRNVMRDIPTALIYSNDSLGLVKNTPEAIKEMLTNGKLWNQYQAMGGTRSGLFNYEKGVKIDFAGNKKSLPKKILSGTGDALEMANNMTETLPRFAEYITSIKKGEPPMLALMRASEITTDFSRFGKQTKRADAVVPYLNASVQGLDKFFRQVRDKPLQTMAKGGLVVSIPALILDQVNKNNKDYNEMTTRERNNYYHIPVGDKFIRIPRSREVGVLFGTALEWISRKARGQEVTGEEIKETLKSNFTPVNGFDSNIIKPALNFIDIATGKNTDAKNFFGSNIVSQSLQRYSPGQQFTESTTTLSKALGEFLDVPPVAIDYLFDSYLGVIADIGMPLLTDNKKKALSPFENAFIADPVFKSASVDKLYSDINKFDQLAADANKKYDFDSKLVTPYEAYRNSLTKVSKELSDLRKQQKEAQAKNNEELVRDLRKRMNDISKKATDSLPTEQELKKEFELFQRKVGK